MDKTNCKLTESDKPVPPVFRELFETVGRLLDTPKRTLAVCIDGRSASGKSTLGRLFATKFDCNLFHTDDFFLRPEQRTAGRLAEPGGNIDRERMLEEIFIDLGSESASWYRPYVCSVMELGEPVKVEPKRLNIVEGSYSAHPVFAPYYDLKVFLDVSPAEQSRRILEREGAEKHRRFMDEWVPLEEKYFEAFRIKDSCDLVYETDIFYN